MASPRFSLRLLTALGLVGGMGWVANAAESLPGPSPFMPTGENTAATPTKDATLELRGIVTNGGNTLFSIYDSTRKTSDWVRLKETGNAYVVRSYDAAHDTVTVDFQGRRLTLALQTAKIASAPLAAPQPQPAIVPRPGPQPIGGPVVMNPSPADERRRLEAIAAEVNRRRMLRQQALQASRRAAQPGQPGTFPPPQQQRR